MAFERYDDAIKKYTIAISLDPEFASAYEGRAGAFERSKRWQEAIDDYTKALELDAKYIAAYSGRAEAYEQLGEYKKAIDDFTQAIANSPCSYYFEKRAELRERIGEHRLAEEDKVKSKQVFNAENMREIDRWNRAIASNAKDADAYRSRGETYFNMQKYSEAVDDITRALSLKKDDQAHSIFPDSSLLYRGQAYAAMGKYNEAIADYNEVVRADGIFIHGDGAWLVMRDLQRYSINGHLHRGEAYLALGRWQPALDDFTRVISEFRQHKLGEAVLENPIEIHPSLASAYHGRAQAYKGQGNAKLADEDFERAKQCSYVDSKPAKSGPSFSSY